MDKQIIVKLLQKDIAELAQLTQGFGEIDALPAVLLQLAEQKAAAVVENLQLLASQNSPAAPTPAQTEPETAAQPVETSQEPIAAAPENEVPAAPVVEPEPQPVAEMPVEEVADVEEPAETAATEEPEMPEEAEEPEMPEIIELPDPAPEANDTPAEPESEPDEPEMETPAEKAPKTPEKHILPHDVVTRNETLQQKISDVKLAITIGDRFLFQRELFGGNGELMSKTITAINACQDLATAEQYLAKKFNWDPESPATERFMQIVRRKF